MALVNKDELVSIDDKICPKCGAKMVLRRSRNGNTFLGCTNYGRSASAGGSCNLPDPNKQKFIDAKKKKNETN